MDRQRLRRFFRQYLLPEPANYTVEHAGAYYLDGSDLERPFRMSVPQRAFVVAVVVVAAILGVRFFSSTVLELGSQNASDAQSVEQNLARPSSVSVLPSLASLMGLSNEEAMAAISENGANVYDIAALTGADEVEAFRFPDDVSSADAVALYTRGISSLNAAQASLLLNGSYYLSITHSDGESGLIRYADFSSGDLAAAIAAAEQAEGFAADSVSDQGTDDAGNTYAAGTVDADGTTYAWRVSAIALDEVYSISGLPEDAVYVGIRLTAA